MMQRNTVWNKTCKKVDGFIMLIRREKHSKNHVYEYITAIRV